MGHCQDHIIVALDTANLSRVETLLDQLDGLIGYYKVGFELFTAHGWQAVERIKKRGHRVFLDLKLHDIPSTVAKTARVLCEHNVDMFNVHTLGGREMMTRAAETVQNYGVRSGKTPVLLGVTVLTSHQEGVFQDDSGIMRSVNEQVLHLAKLARSAGLGGVVSSPREITLLRQELPSDFLMVTPGIRPKGVSQDDQKRTMTPQEAFSAGSDYIVFGRPITEAPDPRQAAQAICGSFL